MSNTLYKINPSMLVSIENEQITTTSLQVAEAFGKEHKNVIQKIERLDIPEDFASANFSAHEEIIQAGAVKRKSKIYRMTKDGFVFLAMGFTGKKAAQFKEAYIHAFNAMAEQLHKSEHEIIKELEARVNELDESAKRLSPEQAGHIQQAVINIWKTRGIPFQTTYHNIKVKFNVDTYKNVLRKDYPALCQHLNIKPIDHSMPEEESFGCFSVEQVNEFDERIVRLSKLFNPLSEPFFDVQGIARLVTGRNPRTGLPEQGYFNPLKPYVN